MWRTTKYDSKSRCGFSKPGPPKKQCPDSPVIAILVKLRASDGGLRTATTIGRRLLRAYWREGFELRVPVILVASNLAEKKKRPNPFEPGP